MAFFSFTIGLLIGIMSTSFYYNYKMDIDGILSQAGFM